MNQTVLPELLPAFIRPDSNAERGRAFHNQSRNLANTSLIQNDSACDVEVVNGLRNVVVTLDAR